MIAMPAHVNARWIATLDDKQLVAAEAQLYSDFRKHESAERTRAGERYMLLQGPPILVNTWQQWTLLNNETRVRGVTVRRKKKY